MDEMENKSEKRWGKILSYMLVAVLASLLTLAIFGENSQSTSGLLTKGSKLEELESVIKSKFIGEVDEGYLEDMAAAAMVDATGDRWSYYIPASEMQAHEELQANAYVGIGVTILELEDGSGFEIQQLEPTGSAKAGGLLLGDIIVAVDGVRVADAGASEVKNMVGGKEGTTVDITVLRGDQELTVTLTRQMILVTVASGQMVTDTVGYIKINNFDDRCCQETVALIEELEQQGAKSFIFDVRFNPGGYKHELVELLDYLLPEGVLFRSEDYRGITWEDTSDASCKNFPMAVLINGNSYSAAEFFAAALVEYDYAVTVGEPTTGKGYFQNTIELSDGSGVNLSVGKYYTPNGVSLAEVGGLVPNVLVEVDEETEAKIYAELLTPEEDPQLQAAIAKLQES